MSEMALTADHIIVIGRGRLLRDQSMATSSPAPEQQGQAVTNVRLSIAM
jgi:hypothetical protein